MTLRRFLSVILGALLWPVAVSAEVVDRSASVQASGQLTQLAEAALVVPTENRNAVAAQAGDVNGDGALDVLVWHRLSDEPPLALMNDGHGQLRDEAKMRLPPLTSGESAAGLLADLDGDGDLDAYVGRQPADAVWINDGLGRFADASAVWLPRDWGGTSELASGDVTGDGRLDLVAVQGGAVRVLENVFGTALRDITEEVLPAALEGVSCVRLADVDADGDLDLAAAGTETIRVLLNDQPRFRVLAARANPRRLPISGMAVSDLNNDGLVDLLVSRRGRTLVVFGGAGGQWTPNERLLPSSGFANGVAVADVNGDQRPDVLLPITGPNALYLNPGPSSPSWQPDPRWLPADNEASRCALIGDFNGDGLLDVYVANDGQDRLLLQQQPASP